MSVSFLHTADLHLGSQLKTQHQGSSQSSDVLDSAVYAAVERLFDVALEEDVDFVIVAGDLYDEDSRSVKANAFLSDQFERTVGSRGYPGIRFVWQPRPRRKRDDVCRPARQRPRVRSRGARGVPLS